LGRNAGEELVGEQLLAIAEDYVACCGPCEAGTNGGPPTALHLERLTKNGEAFSFEPLTSVNFTKEHVAAYEASPTCLPWVKVTRDPKRFRACYSAAQKIGAVTSSEKLYDLLKDAAIKEDQEVFYVVLLDTQLHVRGVSEIARGARDRVMAPVPDVLRLPLVEGAMAFAVAHNHPSGKPLPSEADKHLTKALKEAADTVGILMVDHIIVGAREYYSFSDHKQV
jgi:DNA repair protein RadC